MQTEEIDNQVAIINNSVAVFQTAPQILQSNQIRTTKAVAVGQKILQDIEAAGGVLTPEMDARAMAYLANCSAAKKDMNETRAPVTQVMDALKSMYTTLENELDVKKPDTFAAKIQTHRNNYAARIAKEKQEREAKALLEQQRANEKIDLRAFVETQVNNNYGAYLLNAKQRVITQFNAMTLETIDEVGAQLRSYSPALQQPSYMQMKLSTPMVMKYHTAAELVEIQIAVLGEKYNDHAGNYAAEMAIQRDELVDLLPSKKTELEEIKRLADEAEELRIENEKKEAARKLQLEQANAAQREKLEKEQAAARLEEEKQQKELQEQQQAQQEEKERREREDNERLEREAKEREEKAALDVDSKQQGEKVLTMYAKEEAVAEFVEAPSARQGFSINVTHAAGYVQIFQFWFETQGKTLPIDKIGKTSLDQMKAYCEKVAHKTTEKINSKFLEYVPTYKAVNTKAVAK